MCFHIKTLRLLSLNMENSKDICKNFEENIEKLKRKITEKYEENIRVLNDQKEQFHKILRNYCSSNDSRKQNLPVFPQTFSNSSSNGTRGKSQSSINEAQPARRSNFQPSVTQSSNLGSVPNGTNNGYERVQQNSTILRNSRSNPTQNSNLILNIENIPSTSATLNIYERNPDVLNNNNSSEEIFQNGVEREDFQEEIRGPFVYKPFPAVKLELNDTVRDRKGTLKEHCLHCGTLISRSNLKRHQECCYLKLEGISRKYFCKMPGCDYSIVKLKGSKPYIERHFRTKHRIEPSDRIYELLEIKETKDEEQKTTN